MARIARAHLLSFIEQVRRIGARSRVCVAGWLASNEGRAMHFGSNHRCKSGRGEMYQLEGNREAGRQRRAGRATSDDWRAIGLLLLCVL